MPEPASSTPPTPPQTSAKSSASYTKLYKPSSFTATASNPKSAKNYTQKPLVGFNILAKLLV